MDTKLRFQVELTADKVDDIEDAMEERGIATKREFFDYACTMLKWGIAETRKGYKIAAIDPSTGVARELVMPVLVRQPRCEARVAAKIAAREAAARAGAPPAAGASYDPVSTDPKTARDAAIDAAIRQEIWKAIREKKVSDPDYSEPWEADPGAGLSDRKDPKAATEQRPPSFTR